MSPCMYADQFWQVNSGAADPILRHTSPSWRQVSAAACLQTSGAAGCHSAFTYQRAHSHQVQSRVCRTEAAHVRSMHSFHTISIQWLGGLFSSGMRNIGTRLSTAFAAAANSAAQRGLDGVGHGCGQASDMQSGHIVPRLQHRSPHPCPPTAVITAEGPPHRKLQLSHRAKGKQAIDHSSQPRTTRALPAPPDSRTFDL